MKLGGRLVHGLDMVILPPDLDARLAAAEDRTEDETGTNGGRRWPRLLGGLALLTVAGAVLAWFVPSGAPPESSAAAAPLIRTAPVAR